MKTTISTRVMTGLLGAVMIVAALAMVSVPAGAQAATYGYVDTMGYVRSVSATNWTNAINTAPSIMQNSGVLLLITQADYNLVGKRMSNF